MSLRLFAVFFFLLMNYSVALAGDTPYAIPRSDLPDLEYVAEPQLYQTLQKSYLKIFNSSVGQKILGTFDDCSEEYFVQHFELKDVAAKQARSICEKARLARPAALPVSDEIKAYRESLRQRMSVRISSQPRHHFLKLVASREDISSYTYLGNQTIIRLPEDLVYDEDTLTVLLLHEMTIYFDRKNPANMLGLIMDHGLTTDHFNVDLRVLWKVWNNPFLSEALSVLRSYQQEKILLPKLSHSAQMIFANKWFGRLDQVQDQQSCGLLIVDYISDVLMQNDAYLNYRWTSSSANDHKGPRPEISRSEIIRETQQDLQTFLQVRIQSAKVNTSVCQFALLPEYGPDGILLNNGPRPPIKPGSPEVMIRQDGPLVKIKTEDKPDLRTQWPFYNNLKKEKVLNEESVENFKKAVKDLENGK